MEPARDPQAQPGALERFADWLARRERGEAQDFDALLHAHPALDAELRELHATWMSLAQAGELSAPADGAPDEAASAQAEALLTQSGVRTQPAGRYALEGEVARGGMGAILRVWDADLRRHLAMKIALARDGAPNGASAQRSDAGRLARFLDEARVTGQLDHPGIVPVHELGLDAEGRLYFTMKLVEGRDMKQILELVFAGRDGWNETRALGVILKVCEAMAYAHKKGIIHRDLKPANVMVGGFGEVFVMDWGLARVMNRADARDLRLVARPSAGAADETHLLTMDGAVLGTPAYMPPEQARGEIEALSPRSDVYSIGAMLYHLLARRMPYCPGDGRTSHREVLARVRAGPPPAVHEMNEAVPAELVAICEKAMARDPAQRYADTLAFAEDLRAYLEHRVVAAYETGAVAEARKWIARNRALATACAAAIGILAVAVVVSGSLYVKATRASDRADARAKDLKLANTALAAETRRAEDKAGEAESQRRIAAQRADDVLSLSAGRDLQDLVARADALWPVSPESAEKCAQWLRDARTLLEGRAADAQRGIRAKPGLADHRRKLAELEARALPASAADDPDATQRGLRFESGDDAWWHAQLAALITDLEAFADPDTGLCSHGTNPEHGWGMERRLVLARTIAERSIGGAEAARRWAEAIASIRDPAQCPKYGGLVLAPQLGLLPIGRDARSGLWEFAHLPTGDPAERGPDGALAMQAGTGLVFVLIPGGPFWMGSQKEDAAGRNYDPNSLPEESPPHEVTLDAYFLSKYEVTQDQWLRFTGRNPSAYGPGRVFGGKAVTLLHPVEQVSWSTATTVLHRLDLHLPTEAQWERAARAGTQSVFWTGEEKESLEGAENLSDGFAQRNDGPSTWVYESWLDDGYKTHAPVGSYRANPFGLHDVSGNVYEICREGFGRYDLPERAGDGERRGTDQHSHMLRGGAYHRSAKCSRAAHRTDVSPDYYDFSMGVRPERDVAP